MPSNNNDLLTLSPSSSAVAVATGTSLPRSIEALEVAARDTIGQAMVVWQEQRKPRRGSVHTIQTEHSRDESIPNQSGVMTLSDKAHGKRRSPIAPDQPILIAVCGMTGSGKSNFISHLTGEDVGIGNGLRSRK